jgi:hypothetical protein
MPKIICWQTDCLYNVDGHCRAHEIEYDPVDGCLTTELREEGDEVEGEEKWEKGGMHLLGDEE